MEYLPFVDEHALRIHATAETVWRALWGLEDRRPSGAWDGTVVAGDALVGFHVRECIPGRVLALRGRHRFSRYELRFDFDRARDDKVTLHAKTFAVFPGSLGGLYRALVIGTGTHGIVVRRMLHSVARRASSEATTLSTRTRAP